MKKFVLRHENDWEKVAIFLSQSEPNIHLLDGDLGAGKTTLVKHYMRLLDRENEVSSPSFGLINQYGSNDESVFHMDLYRLESEKDLLEIGIFEILETKYPVFVEWPNLLLPLMSGLAHTRCKISLNQNERIVEIE